MVEGAPQEGREPGDHDGPVPPRKPDLGVPGLDSRLDLWAAEARSEQAARARSREAWLRRQAAETTTLAGLLTDLADRGRPVGLTTRSGHRHRGVVVDVGTDFLSVRSDSGRQRLIRLSAVEMVRTEPGEPLAMSGRIPDRQGSFHDAVELLGAERPAISAVTRSGETTRGTLDWVGADVVCVRAAADTGFLTYLSLESIEELGAV